MKKIKFIPALLTVAMLSACTGVRVSLKEPRFTSAGKEVTQAEFKASFVGALLENEFYKEDKNLSSKLFKQKIGSKNVQKRVKNTKTYYKSETLQSKDSVLQYDSKNLGVKTESISKMQGTIKSQEEDTKMSQIDSETYYVQKGVEDTVNDIIEISIEKTQYHTLGILPEGANPKTFLDNYVGSLYMETLNASSMMHYVEATDVAYYRFYENKKKNTYTVTYKEIFETVQKGTINGETVDIMRYELSQENKSQVDFTEGNEAIRVSTKQTVAYTILADYDGYTKGEILEIEMINYLDFTAVDKDVRLKNYTNLSDYRYII